jgi:proline dehydrogenase
MTFLCSIGYVISYHGWERHVRLVVVVPRNIRHDKNRVAIDLKAWALCTYSQIRVLETDQKSLLADNIMYTALRHMRLSLPHKPASICSKSLFAEPQASPIIYNSLQQARHAHSRRNVSYSATGTESSGRPASASLAKMPKPLPPLSIMPLPNLIRSYLITAVSSSPILLRTSLGALKLLAHSRSSFLSPDRNPVLHFLLKRTVYAQFCAGETAAEVDQTINRLKRMGYKGVMLCYAREVCMGENEAKSLSSMGSEDMFNAKDISDWARGTLATVSMAQTGDFVSLKFTGAGTQALKHLAENKPPAPLLGEAITEVCELAKARKVRLQFDAEQHAVQAGIDSWTMEYSRRYNREGKALVYGTYQAYKKSTPGTLVRHLEQARKENFVLGVKLVRGAYLGSDPRHLFWDTIEDTHKTYDGIAESLMRRAYNEPLRPVSPGAKGPPIVNLVLAGHNSASVTKAQEIRNSQAAAGEPRIDLTYGQLTGMAENISCGLVHAGQLAKENGWESTVDIPRAYQYLAWGTVGECSQYLVRRAEENQDAVARTKDGRKALGKELLRRLGLLAE